MGKIRALGDSIAAKFGLAVIPAWRLEHYETATRMREFFDRYSVDLVLDVGGNVGQYRDFLRHHLRYSGWIASFEPAPDPFATLRVRSSGDPYWKVFQTALGKAPSVAQFNVSAESTLSSLRKPDFNHSDHAASKRAVVQQIDVRIDTIDRLLPALMTSLGTQCPYLKMDTQGFDLEVLRGAEQSLSQFVGLQFEGSVIPLYQDMPSFADMLSYLTARGFALSDMFPVSKDRTLKLIEFDCIMVNAS